MDRMHVVTTYKVKIEGTYDGKDLSGTYNAGSVWKKQEWEMAGHLSHERETGASRGAMRPRSGESRVGQIALCQRRGMR